MLQLNNIVKIFNKGTVDENVLFNDFSFKVNKGDFISVIGSNGSGKTTLLNLACGTMQPDSGSVIFEGKDIITEEAHIFLIKFATALPANTGKAAPVAIPIAGKNK